MTNKEKLTAVRTKIEWLMNNHDSALDYEAALEDVRNFIDSLQEEPIDINAMAEAYRKRLVSQANGVSNSPLVSMCLTSYKHGIQDVLSEQELVKSTNISKDLQEEPVSKIDFEQELYKHFGHVKDFTIGVSIAKRFYEMGRNHQEPVSEDLEEAANNALNNVLNAHEIVNVRSCLEMFKYGAKWQKEKEYTCYEEAFEDGAKWKVENLWKTADGDDLPETDREVIALVQDYPDDKDHLRVAFAHRPNKYAKVWNSDLGEEQVVEIEGYDKGGWNISNVKWWLDCSLPKEIEL